MENNPLLTLRPGDVPMTFAVCFNSDCPRQTQCLRYAAGQAVMPQRDHGPSVFPNALKSDGSCRFFFLFRTIQAAWGFSALFKKVRHEDYPTLRWLLKDFIGSDRQFYRYNRGDYKLTPEEQAKVLNIFRRYGYDTQDMRFDHYEEMVDFIEK